MNIYILNIYMSNIFYLFAVRVMYLETEIICDIL